MRSRGSAAVAAMLAALTTSGCASMGMPSVGECAPYLVGGGVLGGVTGASTGGNRERRAVVGAAVGATAGYALCTQLVRQKRELDLRFAALERQMGSVPGGGERPVVRSSTMDELTLTLDLDLRFATGRSTLDPSVLAHLDALAESLREHPESEVTIAGHTDVTGNPDRNLQLSRERAQAVSTHLQRRGVAQSRLVVRGYGSTQLRDPGSTSAAHARNRRVEVTIVPYAPTT